MFSSLQSVFEKVSNQKNITTTLNSSHVCFRFQEFLKTTGFECKVSKIKNANIYLETTDSSLKQAIYFNKTKLLKDFKEEFPESKLEKILFRN